MTHTEWVIIGVGAAIALVVIIATTQTVKRLNLMTNLLEQANDRRQDNHVGERRNRQAQ